ncbi:MAG: GNAT family N-acetyltransferase [Planctomycetaceae bacterium]
MSTTSSIAGYEVTREESVQRVLADLVAMLNTTRRQEVDERRFDWMYRSNPDGEAALWFVRNGSGVVAGFAAALPRRMLVQGQQRTCWNCADLSVLPQFRRNGLAVRLRQAARAGVEQGQVDFLYAHPNAAAAGAHEKAGNLAVGQMVRYARPLRSAAYLDHLLRSRTLSRAAAAVIDPVLRLSGGGVFHRMAHRVRIVNHCRFDERFDVLFERYAAAAAVLGIRDAGYLNWRYTENPMYATHAVLAEDEGRLCGYLLFMRTDDQLLVKDVFPPCDPGVLRDLVSAVIREGFRQEMQSVSVTLLEGSPVLSVFEEFGFSLRPDRSRMFAYAPTECPFREDVLQAKSWFLTVGDRDV